MHGSFFILSLYSAVWQMLKIGFHIERSYELLCFGSLATLVYLFGFFMAAMKNYAFISAGSAYLFEILFALPLVTDLR